MVAGRIVVSIVSVSDEKPTYPTHPVDVELTPPKPSAARRMAAMLADYPNAKFLGPGYPALKYTSPPLAALETFLNMFVLRGANKKTGIWGLDELDLVRRLAGEDHSFKQKVASLRAEWDGYGPTGGSLFVRQVIAGILNKDFPGAHFDATRMLPVHGNTQALSVFTELRLESTKGHSSAVITDERTYTGALSLFRDKNIKVFDAQLDDEGPIPSSLDKAITDAKAAGHQVLYYYTMPEGHNPTGLTFSLQRRKDILAILKKHGVYCFEDNAYSYLKLTDDEVLPPLAALDHDGLVAYGITFSKIFSPASRLALLHLPFNWMDKLGSEYDVLSGSAAKAGLQTLFPSPMNWMSLLAYLHGDDGVPKSMWDLNRERANYYRRQYEILIAGLKHYFAQLPEIFTFKDNAQHGFFVEGVYGPGVDLSATQIGEQLLVENEILTLPMEDFMPPSAQERDPLTSKRVRLCASYTKAFDGEEVEEEMVTAVNAFGQGVYNIYGVAPIAPFSLGMMVR